MATPFGKIFDRAVFQMTDYGFLKADTDAKRVLYEKALLRYLQSAITDFQHACRYDITMYDDNEQSFDADLGDEEIEILSMGVVYHWLSAKTLNSDLLRNILRPSDYNTYSPANLLKEIRSLREEVGMEYRGRINTYSFRYGKTTTNNA